VLLDVGLPDGSGLDLIPDIQHEQPYAAIVILSGDDVSKEKHNTVEAVLLKNRLTTEQLVNVIQSRIHGSQS
jgi:DNA-binding NarL/FixJ family response regulator